MKTVVHIAGIFDDGPYFGEGFKVDRTEINVLSGVLKHFLDNLKGPPLILPTVLDGLKEWAVARVEPQLEKIARAIAGNLLKFLPLGNMSLLTYLFDFFLRVLNCPQNGVRPEQIASIFGHNIIGRRMQREDQTVIVWLIYEWPSVVRELYREGSGNDAWGPGKAPTVSVQRETNNQSISTHQARWHAEQRQHAQAVAFQKAAQRNKPIQPNYRPPQRPSQQIVPQQKRHPSTFSSVSRPGHCLVPEPRPPERRLEVRVERPLTRASSRCRAASFASTASAYSNGELSFNRGE